jgi:hypothetical protein
VDFIQKPLKLLCDNSSAALYATNNRSTKSKYIDIKFLIVKKRLQINNLCIEHIGTDSILADSLTKGLSPNKFHEHVTRMGIIPI